MNHLTLPPTDMLIGRHVLIGTSMAMGCLCRNDADFAPLRAGAVVTVARFLRGAIPRREYGDAPPSPPADWRRHP